MFGSRNHKLDLPGKAVSSSSKRGSNWSEMFLRGMLLLIIWLTVVPVVNGEQATSHEMEDVARNWVDEMVHKQGTWAKETNPQVLGVHEITQDGVLLARYYDVSPKGFVVVPVLKEMSPVKMYSDESNLDESQESGILQLLRDVLSERLELYVKTYGSLDAVQPSGDEVMFDHQHKVAWDRLAVSAKDFRTGNAMAPLAEGGPLLTSSWHQRAPYNDLCPDGDGGRCVVGCVATSASQIMDFWEWPLSGVGSYGYWWNGDGIVPGAWLTADFSDSYDWANMPDSCDDVDGCTPDEEAALAELGYEVGVSLDMGYAAGGSGTSMTMAIFPTHFIFSSSITREYRSDHTQMSWFSVIQEEINNGRPMWYGIHSHAIVCDGWRDQGGVQLEIHMNYGWGQGNNTWYVMDNLYCGWVTGDICPYEMEHVTTHIEPQYEPEIVYDGKTLDDSGGDGDGHADAGETVQLSLIIQNNGNDAANTSGVLSSLDAYVTVTTSTAAFDASIPWGEQSTSLTPFVVEVDPLCPDPHIATLELEITADGPYSRTETLYMFVGDTPGLTDDLESGEGHWTHGVISPGYTNQWHMETYRAHSGATSWKMGGSGSGNYTDLVDAGLVTPLFLLPPDAKLSFWHWINAETAWDGAILMISSGDGQWTRIDPVGGYPYNIIDNPASPFEAGTPCYSGSYGWTEAVFDLSEYSGVAQIMFRFGSDAGENREGW